ncbi:uncharacterized protein K02A2.6-like [Rhopilema esculentum]|uniref:uncharacterized protein K02A2.6-like n=1 Tax=Rhopilema esculentum TaxID=499914 RepID=UPI0031D8DD4C
MEADLEEEYQKGITKGVWEATQFCQFGTPVVPIKKAVLPGQKKPKIRVCGDYSVTVNHQLEDHRHPLPLPEDLMRRLGGGYGFTKIDLADAYNQIKLAPEKLATIAEPLYKLTKKTVKWKWQQEHQKSFQRLKDLLSSKNVLVHFEEKHTLGLACDASNSGIGAVLFHRFPDGSERPIANVFKTLTESQRNYSQIQKEALAIVFGLKKFYQYLFGRKFVLVTDHRPLLALFGPGKDGPLMAANRLARWALMLSQFNNKIEFRKTKDHANADALSRLSLQEDSQFDEEESVDDTLMVCQIQTIDEKVTPAEQGSLARESAKDPIISMVMRFIREGWQPKKNDEGTEMHRFRQVATLLSICNGCLVHGWRVVIPASMRRNVLGLLHLGHFGMQRMKQLARTAVYWPNIDEDIEAICRHCIPCGQHQNRPAKPAIHPWMLPEKPWSRLHLDHAINFMGTNWLLLTDAYSKYPCIHPTQSVSAKATVDLLEQDFAHFGYPHTLVTDNASAFMSVEFQTWCKERLNLEQLNDLCKLSSRHSRSQVFLPEKPAHTAQGKQAREATKSQQKEIISKVVTSYKVEDPVYALYFGPRRDKEGRWVPAVIIKRKGSRSFNVRVQPKGPTWRRHLEKLQPRYASVEDDDPGVPPSPSTERATPPLISAATSVELPGSATERRPATPEYGPHNPRRSKLAPKPKKIFSPSP